MAAEKIAVAVGFYGEDKEKGPCEDCHHKKHSGTCEECKLAENTHGWIGSPCV